jgi:tetratricopeptide (TPR) repeat protein
MADVYTDWCYWCKVLDKNTYSTKSVGEYANNNYVAIKINAEKGDGVDFAKQFGVRGYPTILFLDEKGKEVDRVVGYQPADKFLVSMKTARMGGVQGLEDQFKQHPNDPAIAGVLAQKYSDKGDTVRATELYKQVVALDPKDSLKLADQAAYYLAVQASHTGNLAPLEQYTTDYPATENTAQAHMVLIHNYLQKGDGTNAEKHFKIVSASNPGNAQMFNSYAWECSEKKINLESATIYADKAITLSKDNTAKAECMDTKAAILYAQDKVQDALTLEKKAIGLVDNNQTNARLRAELKKNLAKFEKELAQK